MVVDQIFSVVDGDRVDVVNVLVIFSDGKINSRSVLYVDVLKFLQVSDKEICIEFQKYVKKEEIIYKGLLG